MFQLYPTSGDSPAGPLNRTPPYLAIYRQAVINEANRAAIINKLKAIAFKTFKVAQIKYNAQGVGCPLALPPAAMQPSLIKFDPAKPTVKLMTLPVPNNVDQFTNQCCPGALANSLDYLATLGVPLKLGNINLMNVYGYNNPQRPGQPNPQPPQSLEAQIDVRMQRSDGMGTFTTEIIKPGKLQFLVDINVINLGLTHEGFFCDPTLVGGACGLPLVNCEGITCDMNGKNCKGADISVACPQCNNKMLTSMSMGLIPDKNFVENAISTDKSDLEGVIAFNANLPFTGGGHCIRIIGYAEVGGFPFIVFVQDALQGDPAKEGKGGTGVTDGGYLGSFILDYKPGLSLFNFINPGGNLIVDLLAEKPPAK